MKILWVLLFLICSLGVYSYAQGQDSVSLRMWDGENGEPVGDAICELRRQRRILSYAISDSLGRCRLRLREGCDTLVVSKLGYCTRRFGLKSILGTKGYVPVVLTPSLEQIEAVRVHAKAARRKGDTISYNVEAYRKSGDRYIKSILKKIPGVDIKPSGEILYNGEAINRFYIEGQDLLGSQYNQATENLPANAVSQVQILEDHQPIKMLREHVGSDRAAINIRLKRGFWVRPFGEAACGLGRPFPLWDGRLFLMQVAKLNQLLVQGRSNNYGQSLRNDVYSARETRLRLSQGHPSSLLYPPSASRPPVDLRRYLDNRSLSWGANDLVNLGKDRSMRVNVVGYEDWTYARHRSERLYGGTSPVRLDEQYSTAGRTQIYRPVLTYTFNGNSVYLEESLEFEFENGHYSAAIGGNGRQFAQEITQRPLRLENTLSLSGMRNGQLYTVQSYLRYLFRRETLTRESGGELFEADYSYADVVSRHELGTVVEIYGQSLELYFNLDYSRHDYRTAYSHAQGRGRLDRGLLGGSLSLSRRWDRLSIRVGSDLGLRLFRLGMQGPRNRKHESQFSYSPSASLSYRLNSHWAFELRGGYQAEPVVEDFYSPLGIWSNYRSVRLMPEGIYTSQSLRGSGGFKYEDLIGMVFARMSLGYTRRVAPIYWSYQVGNSLTRRIPVYEASPSEYILATGRVEKSFPHQGIAVRANAFFSQQVGGQSLGAVRVGCTSRAATLQISTEFSILEGLGIAHSVSGNGYWQRTTITSGDLRLGMQQGLTLNWAVGHGLFSRMAYSMQADGMGERTYRFSHFLDAELLYRIPKTRFELSAWVHNILGVDSYSVLREEPLYQERLYMPLRGREFLLRLLFRI